MKIKDKAPHPRKIKAMKAILVFILAFVATLGYMSLEASTKQWMLPSTLLTDLSNVNGEFRYASLDERIEHECVALTMFLEGRGKKVAAERAMIGMVIINRADRPGRRWPSHGCDVVMQPGQFEPVSNNTDVLHALHLITLGDFDAAERYVLANYNSIDIAAYHLIRTEAYQLIKDRGESANWVDADHFFAPKVLRNRSVPTPSWVNNMTVVASAGGHLFLKE